MDCLRDFWKGWGWSDQVPDHLPEICLNVSKNVSNSLMWQLSIGRSYAIFVGLLS